MSQRYSLGARLGAVAEMVPEGLSMADIGTDHGRLPAWLLRTGRVPRVIAIDRSQGPLSAARDRLDGLSVELRLGDGLSVLDTGEVHTVVLAGMGGKRVVGILESHPSVTGSLGRIVVQPQSEAEWLRRWLVGQQWSLVDEVVVKERGRFYSVMAWEPGEDEFSWSESDFAFGPMNVRRGGHTARAWIRDELRHVKENLASMIVNSSERTGADLLVRRCDLLESVLARMPR